MSKRNSGPRLSRRYAFVKRRLLRLPQESHGIEVDYCPLPDIVPDEGGFWLGLAVDHDTASGHRACTSTGCMWTPRKERSPTTEAVQTKKTSRRIIG